MPKAFQSSEGEPDAFCDPLSKIDMEDIRKFHNSLGEHFCESLLSIPENVERKSIVACYKYFTDRFIERLQKMVPEKIFEQPTGKAMRDAVDYVTKEKMIVDSHLIDELWTAIVYRARAAETYGGGDAGHLHFMEDLRYCMTILKPEILRKTNPNDHTSRMSREEVQMEFLSTMKERVDLIVFFMVLDELGEFISEQFAVLAKVSLTQKREKLPADSIIRQVMEVSFAVNFAIQRVAYIEKHFVQSHPYLNSVYRMLTLLCLPAPIQYVINEIRKESPIASEFSEEDAVEFIGDVMESAFRHSSDPQKKPRLLVKEFRERWQLSDSALGENLVDYVNLLVIAEAPLQKQQKSKKLKKFTNSFKIESHSWLGRYTFIGGKRSIIHTIRLLQYLSNTVQQGRLAIPKNQSGSNWSDLNANVSRIPVEMDSLLCETILPSLVNMCNNGMLASDLPYQKELLTVFSQIKLFVQHPEHPVSWSLAFSVHSILTSIFEMQGANGWMLLATTSRQTYQKYFQQLEGIRGKYETTIPRPPPTVHTYTQAMCDLRQLAVSQTKRSESIELMSVWNPLCAGSFLTYTAFRGNLVDGMNPTICSRIKVTLHLYNALLQVKAIRPGQVELLDWIFNVFKDCRATWKGTIPPRGQFQFRWWIAWGLSEENAIQIRRNPFHKQVGNCDRRIAPIKLERVAKSFRRVCRQDFTDVEISKKDSTKGVKIGKMDKFEGYVKDAAMAMKENERLLGTNIVVFGFYLNQFYLELFHVCGLTSLVEKYARGVQREKKRSRVQDLNEANHTSWEESEDCLKYQAMSHVFAVSILQRLDDGDVFLKNKCAAFMIEFFNRITPRDIMWFSVENKH